MNLRLLLAGAMALVLSASHACAQTAPGWATGYKPSAAEWNATFAAKQDILSAGSVTGSMLASGAAAANLSTMLPGLSASINASGVPGITGPWYIYSGNSDYSGNPTFTVDRRTYSGSGTYSQVYNAIKARCYTGTTNAGFEWCFHAEVAAYSRASTNAENVAANGTLRKVPYNDFVTTTGASGNGTTATLTYPGTTPVPVGNSIKVAGITPSGYNSPSGLSNKVTASSCASGSCSVSYANATTGAQTVAGTVLNVSTSYGAGGNFVCSLETGEIDPVKPCIGAEIDIYTNAATTDANKNMVGTQVQAKGPAGSKIGRLNLWANSGGGTVDRMLDASVSGWLGLDFTNSTFSGSTIYMKQNQQICFDGDNTGACARYMLWNGSSLIYQVPGGTAFSVGDGGTVTVNRVLGGTGSDLKLTANTGKALQLGVNSTDNVYTYDVSGFYPENDNLRTLGALGKRWSTVYGVHLGESGSPFTDAYVAGSVIGLNSSNGATDFSDPSGGKQFEIYPFPNAVNYFSVEGNIAGGAPTLFAQGSDANIDADIAAKGTGSVVLGNGLGTLAQFNNYSALPNTVWPLIQSAQGSTVIYSAGGSGANVNISMLPIGTGGFSAGPAQTVTGTNATALGSSNKASGYASAAIGIASYAQGAYSLSTGAYSFDNSVVGKRSHSSAHLGSARGTTQISEQVFAATTSSATPVTATSDAGGSSTLNTIQVQPNQTVASRILIVARNTSTGASAMWNALAYWNEGATASTLVLVYSTGTGAPLASTGTGSTWTATLGTNTTTGYGYVICTGAAGETIRWTVRVDNVEDMNG
jgi:hypothetical protein